MQQSVAQRNFLTRGFLNGKMATGFNADGEFVTLAEAHGAEELPLEAVVIDEMILTANGPEAAAQSALEYMKLLPSIILNTPLLHVHNH